MADAGYLEEAAAELRKARDDNEKRAGSVPSLAAGMPVADISRQVNDRRMQIADGFIRLARIQAAAQVTEARDG